MNVLKCIVLIEQSFIECASNKTFSNINEGFSLGDIKINSFKYRFETGDSEASRWTVGWCTRPVVELRILAAVSAMTPRGHQHPLQAGVIDYVKESILSCKG